MKFEKLYSITLLLLGATGLFSGSCQAQTPMDPGQLPARTTFYLLWRGTPTGEIRKNNSLYSLWDDSDFAAARSSFMETVLSNTAKEKDKTAPTREELAQYVSLLDNAFLIGYVRRPETSATAKTAPATTAPSWNGMFFVYDRTGKEELLSKAVLRMRGAEKDIPKLTNITVAGVSALKIERKNGVTYWTENGKYAVGANEPAVFEEILHLLSGKTGSGSLSQSPAYQEAKPLLSGGILEFYLSIPNVKEFALDSQGDSAAQLKPFLNALKLDSVHSLAGHITLEGTKTHMAGAILGDTAPGGLFDLFAEGQTKPASMAYISPSTVYYSESQFDLPGLYNIIKRVMEQAGPNTAQMIAPLETMASTRLGMPLSQALSLTTGEFASLQSSPTLEDSQKVYFLGINNKPDALKLTRTIFGDRISSERNEGSTTFLKISLGGGQSASGVAQWNFYHVAMTPTFVLGATKSDTLRKYLEQSSAGTEPTLPQNVLQARGQYPEKLDSFTYLNFQKIDWAGWKARSVAEANKAAQTAKSIDVAHSQKQFADWLSQVNPDVFPLHLHTITGASWKDAKGVHFDEWLE